MDGTVAAPCPIAEDETIPCRELFYALVNIDEHYDLLPTAAGLVARTLHDADPLDLPDALRWDSGVPDEPWLERAAA